MATEKKQESSKALVYIDGKVSVLDELDPTIDQPRHPLAESLDDFMQRVDDIFFAARGMVPASIELLNRKMKRVSKALDAAEKKIQTGSPAEASHAGAAIVEAGHEAERIYRSKLPEVVERSLFVNLFSEYDHFFGLVLRELYRRRPDLLASLSKQISFEELLKFESLDSVKNAVLEAEIETIRRESYIEQFSILQRKFGLPLTKFDEWPQFVEASQRRNLMVHCGGHVSEQYLQVCDGAGYKFEKRPRVGEKLEIGFEYFESRSSLVARVAFMLTHTLWKKVLPAEASQANDELNEQLYRLLCAKRWRTAASLGAFSLTESMLSNTSDMQHRIRLCNAGIALKNLKRGDELKRLLGSIDWSASIRDFRLALAVLEDRPGDAANLMRQIGKKGELVHEVAYHQWPLFGGFRELPEFHQAYQEVFGYPFLLKAEKSAEVTRSRLEQVKDQHLPSITSEVEASKPVPRKRRVATSAKKPLA